MSLEIEIIDTQFKVVFRGGYGSLPITEDYVIKMSNELFGESEPCVVYRNYILNKINLALDDLLQYVKNNSYAEIDAVYIPQQIKNLFLFYDWNVLKIRFSHVRPGR